MVDVSKVKVTVELNATSPNELINEHVVYMPYGTFVFTSGKAQMTQENADKLKAEGIVK